MNPVIEWLDQLCQEALDAAHNGDTGLANRLGRSFAIKYYFDNVFSTRAVSRATFQSMVNYMTECERVYNEVKADELREGKETARDGEITALKTEVSELKDLLKSFMESQKPAESKGKGKKATEDTGE